MNFLAYISGQLTGVLADLESSVPGFVHGDIKPANLLLGMAMLRMRQFDMAERMLDAAHGLDPSNKVIQHYRGAVLLARKRCKESARAKAHKKFGLEQAKIDQACKWLKAVGLC